MNSFDANMTLSEYLWETNQCFYFSRIDELLWLDCTSFKGDLVHTHTHTQRGRAYKMKIEMKQTVILDVERCAVALSKFKIQIHLMFKW